MKDRRDPPRVLFPRAESSVSRLASFPALISLLLLALTFSPLSAEPAEVPRLRAGIAIRFDEPESVPDTAVTRTVLARSLAEAPRIDGLLGEEEWRDAASLTELSEAGGLAPPKVRTRVRVGHFQGRLFVGVLCEEPEPARRTAPAFRSRDRFIWMDDSIHILLDSRHDREEVFVVAVNPAGAVTDYRVREGRKSLAWDSRCVAAAAPTATGWAVEVAIPRSALADPENDVIGFNVVRRRPGAEGEPFAWNPTTALFERGDALGNLSFQTRPCSIRKVEVGWPYVGLNRIRVWLRNDAEVEKTLRAGLATRWPDGRVDKSKYQITLPAGTMAICVFSHRIARAGPCDLAFALVDAADGELIARFSRPGLRVAPSALSLSLLSAEGDEGPVRLRFRILLPKRALVDISLMATVREDAGFKTLGKSVARRPASRSGEIVIDVASLRGGAYRLDAYLTRRGKILARVREDFTLPEKPADGAGMHDEIDR